MPIFLDCHTTAELPGELIYDFMRAARQVRPNDLGVIPIDLYCGNDHRIFCIFKAPDEAAIRQSHAARAVVCHRILRVCSADGGGADFSPEEQAVVRQLLSRSAPDTRNYHALRNGRDLRQVG